MREYLIVDDNLPFAENLAEILEERADTAHVETCGEAAIERVRQRRFDALLTDMRMPVMGGAEVIHRIRRIDPGLPAIAITAYVEDDELEAARREGLLAVLQKPVVVPELLSLLQRARRDGLVAIVEDDVAMADNLTELLRARGFSVVAAQTVMQAERLGGVRPFAAIVDLRVPGGRDGEAMVRLEARYPGLPMIVVTAHDDCVPPVRPYALLRKPFTSESILASLEALYAERET